MGENRKQVAVGQNDANDPPRTSGGTAFFQFGALFALAT
jgi:hypothetical protein